ncbi:helix-turn-helix domain-containing protein [Embleya sp. NPDC050154]|uniref:helix-turn-helix domain-containing protein n=1 Tax=unclassified Embleya TaxID=2699296 RepID=UPI003799EC75
MNDRRELADFLVCSRGRLSPADVGLPDGARRRTAGLRREEVARLAGMSVDYYARLEQNRGPNPSPQLLAALARALRLDRAGRDHLFHLAGQVPPGRSSGCDEHVSPALLLMLDRLHDVPAQVLSDLGDVLAQNAMAMALMGPNVGRNLLVRWFTEPASRVRYRAVDVEGMSRAYVADLRAAGELRRHGARPAALVARLRSESAEFAALWDAGRAWPPGADVRGVAGRREAEETIRHPEVGEIALRCQVLDAVEAAQRMVVYTAAPGSSAADRLALLRVVGVQVLFGAVAPDANRVE